MNKNYRWNPSMKDTRETSTSYCYRKTVSIFLMVDLSFKPLLTNFLRQREHIAAYFMQRKYASYIWWFYSNDKWLSFHSSQQHFYKPSTLRKHMYFPSLNNSPCEYIKESFLKIYFMTDLYGIKISEKIVFSSAELF